MSLLATYHQNQEARDVIVGLLFVAVIAVIVYFGCALARRPDWGRTGAAVVVVVGALLVLLDHL